MNRAIKVIFYFSLFLAVSCMAFYAGSNAPRLLGNLGVESAYARISPNLYDDRFQLLNEAYHIINSRFVEKLDSEEKQQQLEYGAIRGMLKSLDDQYTRFMDPSSYKNMTIETKGKFGGVGIVIGIRNEQLTVISPLEDTPAYKAGLESGDIIIKIDGVSTEDMALDDAVARIRGNPGDKVVLTIWRRDFDSFEGKDIEIIRDIIELKPINESRMIEGTDIGYVKLETFSRVSREKLKENILNYRDNDGMKALILDLRGNPGGLLESAVDVCNLFIDEGPIVHRQDRQGRLKTYYARSGQKLISMPMVVLVNEYSASASEIVAGALQDHGVATIMGETTFGKGLVQTVYRLSDDSAILVTTDKYLTAKKRDINEKGIEPDIVVSKYAVDTHEKKEESEEDEREPGTIGKFPLSDLEGKNGIIYNGMPIKDISYKELDGKRYLEIDDAARLFNVAVQLNENSKILYIEKDPDALDKKKDDVQLKRAIEFLEEKLAG